MTDWPSTHKGPLLTRLRRKWFGLNAAEIAQRQTCVAEMQLQAMQRSAEEDRLWDEWSKANGHRFPPTPGRVITGGDVVHWPMPTDEHMKEFHAYYAANRKF